MLLSAMTPTQNSWRKKKRIREQRKNEAIEDEAAARTILMLSSHPPVLTPPNSGHRPSKSNFDRPTPAYYDDHENAPNMYDAVADISDYDEQSRDIGRFLPKKQPQSVPPPAIIHSQDKETGSPRQYYQYDRPLPPPPQYFYIQPPMFGRTLPEDPFQ
jgi:hypothetical protein